jgi:hypothetical protein
VRSPSLSDWSLVLCGDTSRECGETAEDVYLYAWGLYRNECIGSGWMFPPPQSPPFFLKTEDDFYKSLPVHCRPIQMLVSCGPTKSGMLESLWWMSEAEGPFQQKQLPDLWDPAVPWSAEYRHLELLERLLCRTQSLDCFLC